MGAALKKSASRPDRSTQLTVLPGGGEPDVETLLRDALSAALPPDTHDLLLATAIASRPMNGLPSTREDLLSFVFGPLKDGLETAFGVDEASQVMTHVVHALDLRESQSGIRKRVERPRQQVVSEHDRATVRSAPDAQKLVLLVCRSAVVWAELEAALAGHASVMASGHTPTVRAALCRRPGPVVVVVDCRSGIDDAMLSEIVPELPLGSEVVLWGRRERVTAILERVEDAFEAWTRCGDETPAEDVATLVRDLL